MGMHVMYMFSTSVIATVAIAALAVGSGALRGTLRVLDPSEGAAVVVEALGISNAV